MNSLHIPQVLRSLMAALLLMVAPFAFAGTILIHGDSLSAGYGVPQGQEWAALLQKQLQSAGYAKEQVINTSISGETTSGGVARLPKLLTQHQPSIVILELGANDGLRGQSLAAMEKNLRAMIEQSQKAGAKVLLLGIRIPPNYGTRYTNDFHQVFFKLQKEFKLAFVPFMLEGVAGYDKLMQKDGLHPDAKAQPQIMQAVWKALRPMLKKSK